jgi:hypothetical protein
MPIGSGAIDAPAGANWTGVYGFRAKADFACLSRGAEDANRRMQSKVVRYAEGLHAIAAQRGDVGATLRPSQDPQHRRAERLAFRRRIGTLVNQLTISDEGVEQAAGLSDSR